VQKVFSKRRQEDFSGVIISPRRCGPVVKKHTHRPGERGVINAKTTSISKFNHQFEKIEDQSCLRDLRQNLIRISLEQGFATLLINQEIYSTLGREAVR